MMSYTSPKLYYKTKIQIDRFKGIMIDSIGFFSASTSSSVPLQLTGLIQFSITSIKNTILLHIQTIFPLQVLDNLLTNPQLETFRRFSNINYLHLHRASWNMPHFESQPAKAVTITKKTTIFPMWAIALQSALVLTKLSTSQIKDSSL